MSVNLIAAGNCPVVEVGRMDGQCAKTRSAAKERIDESEIDRYTGGDI